MYQSSQGVLCLAKASLNHLPDLQITAVAMPAADSAKCKPANKKKKISDETMDINQLLIKLPILYDYFLIHKKIGEGTYSSVYLATFKNSNGHTKFAIKHLTQNFNLSRIERELNFMQTIGGQDNVVSVLNCLKNGAGDCIVFVMPYLEHKRFSEYVLQMDAKELKVYMRNLFVALRRVHAFNVIHRDVKPGNFLYNRETEEFLLVDFGLAQQIENGKKRSKSTLCDWENQNMPIDYSKRKRSPSDKPLQANKKSILSPLKSRENFMKEKGSRILDLTSPIATPVRRSNVERTPLKSRSYTPSSLSSSSRKKLFCDDTLSLSSRNLSSISQRKNASYGTSWLKSKTENQATNNDRFRLKDHRSFTPLVANRSQLGSFVQVRNSQVVAQKQGGCLCTGVGAICSSCQAKNTLNAPRAGTPGFRPPEVLLKSMQQTTAVDMWAAGVIMLCALSGCYPFFKSPSDMSALVEIMTIFGKDALEKVAAKFGRRVSCSINTEPINLRRMCRIMRSKRMKKGSKPMPDVAKCSNCQQPATSLTCLCQMDEISPVNTCSDGDSFPDSAYHLLLRLLDLDPQTRITAEEALSHPFVRE